MPRGNPKPVVAIRLDRTLTDEVKRYTENLTEAVEEGLALWLKRARRKDEPAPPKKADPLAKHLAPPTARERAVRRA